MATYRILYESLDPLTIGASGDEDKVNRDELEPRDSRRERPRGDLSGRAWACRRRHGGGSPRARRGAGRRAALLRAARGQVPPGDRHRQPVPADTAVEAPARRARRRRSGRDRGGRRACERQGLPDVGVGHRAEDRPRESRPHGEARHRVLPERAAERGDVHTYVGVLAMAHLVCCTGSCAERQDPRPPGGVGGPLGRGRGGSSLGVVASTRRSRSGTTAFIRRQTHYGAYAGPMRSDIDEVATMCELDCTMNVVLDTRGRVIEVMFGSHPYRAPRRDRALQPDLRLRAPGRPGGHRRLRRLRADRPPLLPHRLGACRPTSSSRTAARSSTRAPRPVSRLRWATSLGWR